MGYVPLGRKQIGSFLFCLFLFLMFLEGCIRETSPWTMDKQLSFELLQGATGYQLEHSGRDASELIDQVEIYCSDVESSHVFTVEAIRKLKLVYKTTDPATIYELMLSARTGPTEPNCFPLRGPYVLHVLAFDHDRMRVGNFIYSECPGHYAGVIQTYNIRTVDAAPNMSPFLKSRGIDCPMSE